MIKYFLVGLLAFSFNSLAGVSVVGTRFVFDDNTRRLNIKLVNDNESDYLIKTNISCIDDEFVISPPLFVLLKNTSNILTIIPNKLQKNNRDHLCQLSIATIPKSSAATNNTVALAIRSNFHLIYRHEKLTNADFNQFELIKKAGNQFYLKNNSSFVFTMIIATSKAGAYSIRKTLSPGQVMPITSLCKQARCSLWVSFVDDDESIIKQVNIMAHQ